MLACADGPSRIAYAYPSASASAGQQQQQQQQQKHTYNTHVEHSAHQIANRQWAVGRGDAASRHLAVLVCGGSATRDAHHQPGTAAGGGLVALLIAGEAYGGVQLIDAYPYDPGSYHAQCYLVLVLSHLHPSDSDPGSAFVIGLMAARDDDDVGRSPSSWL
ncbi:hypothetical protein DENSPDRAFT_852990 [Dentipellis sp. KUC8613]|nr:hypothetical protein DENSPDRAFT_852990 [Dentipellis sp. KUC8613]